MPTTPFELRQRLTENHATLGAALKTISASHDISKVLLDLQECYTAALSAATEANRQLTSSPKR